VPFADLWSSTAIRCIDLGILQDQGKHLAAIMKGGRFYKNRCSRQWGQILFKNFKLLEPDHGELRGGYDLLVEDELVRELGEAPITSATADIVDCGGRTLMPGLIDAHVHVIHSEVNIRFLEAMPLTLLTARPRHGCGRCSTAVFTTVRDTGGCDWGIKTAVEQGISWGRAFSLPASRSGPTGGHSDGRRRTDNVEGCTCCNGLQFKSAVADGTDAVRKAAREQMRQGAGPCEDHDVGRRSLALRPSR
jgi:imidazolonepropionase-like amidohydrolase